MGRGVRSVADALFLEELCKHREKSDTRFELAVPELAVEKGTVVAVVGPSGCGKSTLLDLLALVLRPDSASRFDLLTRDGASVGAMAMWRNGGDAALSRFRRENISYVLQTGGLFPFLSVEDNALLPFALKQEMPDREGVRELAQALDIEPYLASMPSTLSGGQRQRAAVLRALAPSPSLILADEPTAALDQRNAQRVLERFAKLVRERGATAIVVTHQPGLLATIADRWIGFDLDYPEKGRIVSTCRETGR